MRASFHQQTLSPQPFCRGGRGERGMTLIEAMIAAVVVSFGVVALIGLNASGWVGLGRSSKATYATALASYRLNDLLGRQFDTSKTDADLLGSAAGATHFDGATNIGPSGEPYTPAGVQLTTGSDAWGAADGWYYRQWTVQDFKLGGSSVVNFKLITVDVGWYDAFSHTPHHVQQVGGKSLQ
jgi:hypothetical protein